MMRTAKLAAIASISAAALSAHANLDLSIGVGTTTDSLGYNFPGDSNGGGQANNAVNIVNAILGLSLGGNNPTSSVGDITRSDNVFPPTALTAATTTGDDPIGSAQTTITLTSGYTYLVAKYGNNEMVWDIASVPSGTTIVIPSDGTGSDFGQQASGLSDETLLDPTTAPIPDGGMALALLGGAFTGLAALRRVIRK